MDGSAAPFVYLILNEAGVKRLTAPKKFLKVPRPISLTQGDTRIALYPLDPVPGLYRLWLRCPVSRQPSPRMKVIRGPVRGEVGPAGAFGVLQGVGMLRQRGLALGGSLDNAIVLGETGVLNNALRF